jgi:hypothetical protein
MSAPWPVCQKCGALVKGPYLVLVKDPAAPTGWANVTLCVKDGREANRIPLAHRERALVLPPEGTT